MPVYCYTTADGHTVERQCPMGRAPSSICVDGARANRDIVAEHRGFRGTLGNWPMKSDALGVNPEDIPEARAHARANGVPVEFDPKTGQAILDNPRQRQKYARLFGIHDRNAGYSDPVPGD